MSATITHIDSEAETLNHRQTHIYYHTDILIKTQAAYTHYNLTPDIDNVEHLIAARPCPPHYSSTHMQSVRKYSYDQLHPVEHRH